jgi:signal transduction histidine kinase
MHELIEGILQFSRIGRVMEKFEAIDLNELIDGVLDMLAPPEGIEITVASDLPTVTGEPTRIQQVFQNLIGNAIKYMGKPEGKIAIQYEDMAAHWQFCIADTGPGIPPQYHEKVFQIFQSLAARDDVESTGIGLALVKKIVEAHNGRVWLESDEGKGSTFYFTLPKQQGANNHAK